MRGTKRTQPGDTVLEVRDLTKAFGRNRVLDSVDLDLVRGTPTVLSGDNGAGKSTLLGCLAGAQPFDRGTLRLAGRPTSVLRGDYWRSVNAILDDFAWFPDLTVFDHFRLMDAGLTRREAVGVLAELGADRYVDRNPVTLSSGQRQRCALASAAIRDWKVLLIDEPERHLDRRSMPAVARFIEALGRRGAVLIASHDDTLTSLPGARKCRLDAGRLTVPA